MYSVQSGSPSPQAGQPRILIVDDDIDTIEECVAALAVLDVPTLTAASVHSALMLLSTESRIGVLITDLRMPSMDGLSLMSETQRLFQDKPCPQFILITGHGTFEAAVTALRMDAVDFLQKPVDRNELVCSAIRALSRYEASVSPDYRAGSRGAPSNQGNDSDGKLQHGEHLNILKIIRARKRRGELLGADLFTDSAWTMLLELYLAALERRLLSVTSLCFASGAPNTTALRRVEDLVTAGLVERTLDINDRRRTHVFLSPAGFEKMSKLLREAKSFHGHV